MLENLGNLGKFEDLGNPGQVEALWNPGSLGSLETEILEILAILETVETEIQETPESLEIEITETLESQDRVEVQENVSVEIIETNPGTTSLHSITKELKGRDPDQEIVIVDPHNHDHIIAQDLETANLCLDLDRENLPDRDQENLQDKDRDDLDHEK